MNREHIEITENKTIVESALILAKHRNKICTLSVVANGTQTFYSLDKSNLLWLLESGFNALRKLDGV